MIIDTGNSLSNQCLQTRFGVERKDLDSVLSLAANGLAKAKDGLLQGGDANLDAVARWPTECQVRIHIYEKHVAIVKTIYRYATGVRLQFINEYIYILDGCYCFA